MHVKKKLIWAQWKMNIMNWKKFKMISLNQQYNNKNNEYNTDYQKIKEQ